MTMTAAAKPEPDDGLAGWSFGRSIRARRRELRKSLLEVAAQACTSGQLLSKYERGEVLPRAPLVIEGIARALGLAPAELADMVAHDRKTRRAIDGRRRGVRVPARRRFAQVLDKLEMAAEALLRQATVSKGTG